MTDLELANTTTAPQGEAPARIANLFGNAPAAAPMVQRTDIARAVSEVQAAMIIARMNPRDERAAMDRIINACTRPTLAESATYAYTKGGSSITGPSIRLAECIAQNWGNMQFGIREVEAKNGVSTVVAYAWDIETNVRREITFTVRHVRSTRSGQYKLEDPREIYELVANQGSRRLRACILAVVPGDVVEAAVNQCAITLKCNVDVTPDGLKKLVETFSKFGVTQAQIEAYCGRRLEAFLPAQVVRLRQIYTSLRDGMSSPGDWFEPERKADEKPGQVTGLRERAAAAKKAGATGGEKA